MQEINCAFEFGGYYGESSARGDGDDIISIREHQLEGSDIRAGPLSRSMLQDILLQLRSLTGDRL